MACNLKSLLGKSLLKRRPFLDQIQEVLDQKSSGFVAWDDDASAKHNGNASGFLPSNTIEIKQGGYGRINGSFTRFEAQSISVPATYGIVYIWIDATGKINQSVDIDTNLGFVLFQVFTGASAPIAYYVARENHAYGFDSLVSQYLHRAAGTVISGGGANIVKGATLGHVAIYGSALYEDHGLISVIDDSAGVGVTWIQDFKNSLGQWEATAFSNVIAPKWNNAGVATALGANKFGAYRLYTVKDDGQGSASRARFIAIMHTAEFASSGLAQSACDSDSIARADGALLTAEVCQLGYITIKNDGVITYVKPAKTTLSTTQQGIAGLATIAFTGLAGDLLSAIFTSKVTTKATTATEAGLNIGADGTAPSSPVDGDVFKTADVLRVRMGSNTRTIPFIEKANTFSTSQSVTGNLTARGISVTRQTNTPTGTTYTWTLTSGNGLGLTLTSSTGNVTVTTASPTAGAYSNIDIVGNASATRTVTLSQTGVTFIMSGKTYGATMLLDTIPINGNACYELYWATATRCFVNRVALV